MVLPPSNQSMSHSLPLPAAPLLLTRTCTLLLLQILDIEDLVQVGRQLRGCPYFGARLLAEDAELVFCPYSYLVDPLIRKSVGIELKDSVLIFDEVGWSVHLRAILASGKCTHGPNSNHDCCLSDLPSSCGQWRCFH